MWLTKNKPISVYSIGNKIITKNSKFKKESLIVMIFKFPNDLIVKISAIAAAIYDHYQELNIFCKNETFVNSRLDLLAMKIKI